MLLLLLLLFPTATGKVVYAIRINSSDPYSLSPNPGRRYVIIFKM